MSSTREPGYYWVKHNSEWRIAFFGKHSHWDSGEHFFGISDFHMDEIDERRIERQAPESFDNTALRELLKKGLELLDKEQVVLIDDSVRKDKYCTGCMKYTVHKRDRQYEFGPYICANCGYVGATR